MRIAKPIVLAVAVVAFSLVGVTPASASSGFYGCPSGSGLAAIAVTSSSAKIYSDTQCKSTLQVRIKYNLQNGVTAYTAWKSSPTSATVFAPSGGSVVSADFRIGATAINGVKP